MRRKRKNRQPNNYISTLIRHILGQPTIENYAGTSYRLAIFGPGIESNRTKQLVRKLLTSHDKCLNAVSLVPGSDEGIGSGVRIEFKKMINFDLICLYSNFKAQRDRQNHQNSRLRAESNKLLRLDAIENNGRYLHLPTLTYIHIYF